MGLQNELTNVASESLPILLVILIANCVRYLRSLTFTILHTPSLSWFHYDHVVVNDNATDPAGSALSGLLLLAEQLNMNRVFSYSYCTNNADCVSGSDCIVCLNRFEKNDRVRKLACRHVFHKECLDGWLDHLNFNCPLCRTPTLVVSDGRRVGLSERRVEWFALS